MATIRPGRTQDASGRFIIVVTFAQYELARTSLELTDEWVPQIAPAASTQVICRVLDSACEEVTDYCRDFVCMGLEREVARFEKVDDGTGNIAPERLGTPRQEKGI